MQIYGVTIPLQFDTNCHIIYFMFEVWRALYLPSNVYDSLTHSSWHVCVDVASRTIRLNTSLFWAYLPASVGLIGSHFFMSSVHLLVGRPFLLLPSNLASIPICAFLGSRVFLGGRYMIHNMIIKWSGKQRVNWADTSDAWDGVIDWGISTSSVHHERWFQGQILLMMTLRDNQSWRCDYTIHHF